MNFATYSHLFEDLLNPDSSTKYDYEKDLLEYSKLNFSRSKRWFKTGDLNEDLVVLIKNSKQKQNWVVITEPWCGDAAHIVPFIVMLAELNSKINIEIQLRDHNSEIASYLTNTTKSIPILIVRNEKNEDLFIWGPRPQPCIEFIKKLKKENISNVDLKKEIQTWYNQDKGVTLQKELVNLFQNLNLNEI